jgi:hypothetical protein
MDAPHTVSVEARMPWINPRWVSASMLTVIIRRNNVWPFVYPPTPQSVDALRFLLLHLGQPFAVGKQVDDPV